MSGRRGPSPLLLATCIALVGCGAEGGDAAPASTADGAAPVASPTAVEVSTLEDESCPGATADAAHPDVVGARFAPVEGDPGAWRVSVTLCSLYDSAARYADAWRVVSPDGDVLGTRVLLHDHAGEQPFTRSLADPVRVPDGVTTVVVEARDLANGWGGVTLEVPLG